MHVVPRALHILRGGPRSLGGDPTDVRGDVHILCDISQIENEVPVDVPGDVADESEDVTHVPDPLHTLRDEAKTLVLIERMVRADVHRLFLCTRQVPEALRQP